MAAPLPTGGVPLPPTPAQKQTYLDNGTWYALSLWPALHVAVSNTWGGPASADKRDWFAGAVSDLLSTSNPPEQEDVEVFLLQVMQDEFECNVEDESEVEVAKTLLGLRKGLGEGDVGGFKRLEERWRTRGGMKHEVHVVDNEGQVLDEEDEEEEFEGFGDDGEGDVEMGEAPAAPREPREKPKPEIDDDGFEKVVGKKKR